MHPFFIVVAMTVAIKDCLWNAFVNSQGLDITTPVGMGSVVGQGLGGWLLAFILAGIFLVIRAAYRGVRFMVWRMMNRPTAA